MSVTPLSNGEQSLPLGTGRTFAEQRRELREDEVDAGAYQACHTADAPVEQAGDQTGRARKRRIRVAPPVAERFRHELSRSN
jgi:hypothetical protein